jgi:1,2-dihydroxy-3-keto-5-methylthiopentene dioxygenase
MTTLVGYREQDPATPIFVTDDPSRIRGTLAEIGVDFERWETNEQITERDAPERILDAYGTWIDDLKRSGGYAVADVITIAPNRPDRVALRQKFLDEHVHTEDEVRFFVAGRGAFYLHAGARVCVVVCERGDLIRVPARTLHWFDMGPEPSLVAIRVFTNPAGWVAEYSGDAIAGRFPRLEPGGLPVG